jgi:hypothetical protein
VEATRSSATDAGPDERSKGVPTPSSIAPRGAVEVHVAIPIGGEADSLMAFASQEELAREGAARAEVEAKAARSKRRRFWMAIAAAVVATSGVTLGVMSTSAGRALAPWLFGVAAAARDARLTVTTTPAGAEVVIDGQRRGVTPLTLAVSPGAHTLLLRGASGERTVSLAATAGADIVRDFELAASAPVPVTGELSIVTDPAGAQVTVDGKAAGASPLTVNGLTPGEHALTVSGPTGSAQRTVQVVAGQMASVVFSLPKVSGPVGGWLTVNAPFEVEVVERGEVIGSSGASKIMLASGRHDLTLVNRALQYEEARRVEVQPGGTSTVRVDPPRVSVNINARPWAEVTLDGRDLGQTPISNAMVAVGSHDIVFRHPQLGERRQTIVVTSKGAQRVAVDLTK